MHVNRADEWHENPFLYGDVSSEQHARRQRAYWTCPKLLHVAAGKNVIVKNDLVFH